MTSETEIDIYKYKNIREEIVTPFLNIIKEYCVTVRDFRGEEKDVLPYLSLLLMSRSAALVNR